MSGAFLTLERIGKCYVDYGSNLKRFASWFGIEVARRSEYWALRDVSFDLAKGEALAVIGPNGAGKSTLLKLITGTVRPTTGKIVVGGQVSAILELGLGFNLEFTGRQNVYQAGGLMGLSEHALTAFMPQIEEFAELGEFFDHPLRTYSSGMQARLAFSLATAVRPDLLIVDEILSVGDSYFQHKSFDRIREFKGQGTSIVLVTHALGDVRVLCNRVLLLDRGKIIRDGLPDEVTDYYNAIIAEKENAKLSIEQRRLKDGWLYTEFGNFMARVETIDLFRAGEPVPVHTVQTGEEVEVRARISINSNLERLVIGHRITDKLGNVIWGTNTWHTRQVIENVRAGQVVFSTLRFTCSLGPGSYALSFGAHRDQHHLSACYHKADNRIVFDVVNDSYSYFIGTAHLRAGFTLDVE